MNRNFNSHLRTALFFVVSLLSTVGIGGSALNQTNQPSREQEIPIPADGNCLYKSIMVGYLLPVANDTELFKVRLGMLVGDDKIMATEESKSDKGDENKDDSKTDIDELWDAASLQSIFLALNQADLLYYLRQQYPFHLLARHMKQHMGIGNNVWGGSRNRNNRQSTSSNDQRVHS